MGESQLNFTSWIDWNNRMLTVSDSGRLLDHIQLDLEDNQVPLPVLHYLYLLATNGKKYQSDKIPEDVVTLNSEILIKSKDRNKKRIKLVFPQDVKNPGDVSVYSPMGAACLGAHEKSRIVFHDGGNFNQAVIEKVLFQPEKEKLFHL